MRYVASARLLLYIIILLLAACTSLSSAQISTYKDPWLCFTIKVPQGWYIDGVRGGFAAFGPAGQPQFNIAQGSVERLTLDNALENLRRGSLGLFVQEVKDFSVDDIPALWVTLKPGTEFQFVALVIAPDCGDGQHALFISASDDTAQEDFEDFLNRIHFIRGV